MGVHGADKRNISAAPYPVEVLDARGARQRVLQAEHVAEVSDDGAVGGDEEGNCRDPGHPLGLKPFDRRLDRGRVRHAEGNLGRAPPVQMSHQFLDIPVPLVGLVMPMRSPVRAVGTVGQQQDAGHALLGLSVGWTKCRHGDGQQKGEQDIESPPVCCHRDLSMDAVLAAVMNAPAGPWTRPC